jgi:hypothetical protein
MHEHWLPQLPRKNNDLETRLAGHHWYEEMVVAYFMTFQRSPWSADQNCGEKLVCPVPTARVWTNFESLAVVSLTTSRYAATSYRWKRNPELHLMCRRSMNAGRREQFKTEFFLRPLSMGPQQQMNRKITFCPTVLYQRYTSIKHNVTV